MDPHRRWKQHAKKPPKKVRADVERFTPWGDHFALEILETCTIEDAKHAERFHIASKSSVKDGYNNLKGSSTSSRKFWKLYRKGVL